jgi:hypothetical protein
MAPVLRAYITVSFCHPRWPRDNRPRSFNGSKRCRVCSTRARERSQSERPDERNPPAAAPNLSSRASPPWCGEAALAAMKPVLLRPICAQSRPDSPSAPMEGGDQQFRIVPFEAIKEREIARAKVRFKIGEFGVHYPYCELVLGPLQFVGCQKFAEFPRTGEEKRGVQSSFCKTQLDWPNTWLPAPPMMKCSWKRSRSWLTPRTWKRQSPRSETF